MEGVVVAGAHMVVALDNQLQAMINCALNVQIGAKARPQTFDDGSRVSPCEAREGRIDGYHAQCRDDVLCVGLELHEATGEGL